MPGIGAQRVPVVLEHLDLAMNGKHLFDERPPEVKQPHRKRTLVFSSECDICFHEELAEVRAQLDTGGGFAAAGGAGFEQHAVGNLARAAVKLLLGESVIAAETTDGLAL